MILEALALQLSARTLLLPSLNAGASYHGHNGLLQRSSGKMIDVSLQSLYLGAGANTVVAGTVNIPGVSIYQPTDRRLVRAVGRTAATRRSTFRCPGDFV